MASAPLRRRQTFTIIAQDPGVKITDASGRSRILTAQVEVPAEQLAPGPRGYRVQVIDYDSSRGVLYPPVEYRILESGLYNDPFAEEPDEVLLGDPSFHAQNVYAIIMRTLARFEFALGRRVSWSFQGHQLQVAPHAFADANAFYSAEDRALLFGYFPKTGAKTGIEPTSADMVFSCLSHDVVVHETTHALVDGLRQRYTDPSSPEQAGFHEGFADVVALLSIFSLPKVVDSIIDKRFNESQTAGKHLGAGGAEPDRQVISLDSLTIEALRESLLLGLAEEFGQEMSGVRRKALRRSVSLEPRPGLIREPEFEEPHRRGEVLVAAMMNAFLQILVKRLEGLGNKPRSGEVVASVRSRSAEQQQQPTQTSDADVVDTPYRYLDRRRVVEEGANVADYLLTMAIRALDYAPPSDIEFCDFLSAMLTADREIRPDDSKYQFRKTLLESFRAYGMEPTSKGDGTESGIWEPPDCELSYDRIHLASLLHDKDEMFRFIWENRDALGLEEDAYTRVLSVRPCTRINPEDGFVLRETAAEYHQILQLQASELKHLGIKIPRDMPEGKELTLYGGGALIFDEFGRVKFHVRNRLLNPERQRRRLDYLWRYGALDPERGLHADGSRARRFAQMHMQRFNIFPLQSEGVADDNYLQSPNARRRHEEEDRDQEDGAQAGDSL
ncbi:MAG TPA: hypothetical protein VGB73_17715 [Pyrinomonadaceae bacterium]